MRGDNTVIYIIAAVILLHFVAGIGYLIYKLTINEVQARLHDLNLIAKIQDASYFLWK